MCGKRFYFKNFDCNNYCFKMNINLNYFECVLGDFDKVCFNNFFSG